MKVLKNNYKKPEPVKITSSKIDTCEWCESEFEYDKEDIIYKAYGSGYVKCPCCGKDTILEDEGIDLTIQNLEYPTHFAHTYIGDIARHISDEEIKHEITRGIAYFRTHKDEWTWFTCFGDFYVVIFRMDDDESYEIMVARDFYETSIPFEAQDYKVG